MRRSRSEFDDTSRGDRRITPAELAQLVDELRVAAERRVIGIAGPPGSGKSTLASYLAQSLSPAPVVVPMDGFHLAQDVINRKGLADKKGSPDTFDAWGFVSLLKRIARPADDSVVFAPKYDRTVGEPIAGAIAVLPSDDLVVVEGNYLLLDAEPWTQVLDLLDLCMFVELDDAIRRQRLIDRHVQFGKSPQRAKEFVDESDERNAELVAPTKARANLIVQMNP